MHGCAKNRLRLISALLLPVLQRTKVGKRTVTDRPRSGLSVTFLPLFNRKERRDPAKDAKKTLMFFETLSVYQVNCVSGLSNIFLYAGKDRFDNFSKVVKSYM